MENKKEMGSSSSFTADLFGFKESTPPPPSSSTGIFGLIFPPPSRVMGRNSSCSELLESIQKQSLANRVWSTEQGTAVKGRCKQRPEIQRVKNKIDTFISPKFVVEQPGEEQEEAGKSEVESNGIAKKKRNSIFQERVDPCPLSSSLCYGGLEDMYILSSSTLGSGSYPTFKYDTVEDDLQIASRGNWWQGSLYY